MKAKYEECHQVEKQLKTLEKKLGQLHFLWTLPTAALIKNRPLARKSCVHFTGALAQCLVRTYIVFWTHSHKYVYCIYNVMFDCTACKKNHGTILLLVLWRCQISCCWKNKKKFLHNNFSCGWLRGHSLNTYSCLYSSIIWTCITVRRKFRQFYKLSHERPCELHRFLAYVIIKFQWIRPKLQYARSAFF